jgi:succinate-acetate transporter protein
VLNFCADNPPGYFRTFGNPIPIGLTAHGLGCLVYGSYCANWRNVGTPLLVSALCLAVCAPGAFLASIMCFICNEVSPYWLVDAG